MRGRMLEAYLELNDTRAQMNTFMDGFEERRPKSLEARQAAGDEAAADDEDLDKR